MNAPHGLTPARLVAGREIRLRVLSRPFVIATALFTLLIAGGTAVSVAAGNQRSTLRVGLAEAPDHAGGAVREVADVAGINVITSRYDEVIDGYSALRGGDLDLLVAGGEVVTEHPEGRNSAIGRLATGTARELGQVERAAAPDLPVRALEPADPDDSRRGIAIGALVVLLMGILTYGGLITGAIVEEKVTRVVELLVSTIRPSQLLAGKVAGIGTAGLVQLSVVGGSAAVAALAFGGSLPEGAAVTIPGILLWFALGFALYGSLYAAAGALISRLEDAQSASFPVTIMILIMYFTTSFADPESEVVRSLSFFPLTAPFAMLPRMAVGDAALWEIAVSVVLTIGLIVFVLRAAGRIFRGGIVRRGPRMRLAEAWAAGAR
jgi:ABC-2 type transport system permease protein